MIKRRGEVSASSHSVPRKGSEKRERTFKVLRQVDMKGGGKGVIAESEITSVEEVVRRKDSAGLLKLTYPK